MRDRRSSREKHSFIQFYFDDWKAGTAHMTRLVRSIYFDVCLYNWDKLKPVPPTTLLIMLGDIDNAGQIIDALVTEGVLKADDHGGIYSPRAIREGQRAYKAWEAKSRGGKNKAKDGDETAEPVGEDGTAVDETPPNPPEKQDSSNSLAKTLTTDSDSDSEPDSEKKKDSDSENLNLECRSVGQEDLIIVVESWNTMARRCGLKAVEKMTAERTGKLVTRLEEHGTRALVEGINLIPAHPFLLGHGENGWKATLDWFLKPDSFVNVIEGRYEPCPGGKAPPKGDGSPVSGEEAEKFNTRLAEMGSSMRWQLDGKAWRLRPM